MNLTELLPNTPPRGATAESVYEAFIKWVEDRGIGLYPAPG